MFFALLVAFDHLPIPEVWFVHLASAALTWSVASVLWKLLWVVRVEARLGQPLLEAPSAN